MLNKLTFLKRSCSTLSRFKNNILLIPGPVNTSEKIKNIVNLDLGSRDDEFIDIIKNMRNNILKIANADSYVYSTVLIPGSGTNGNEAVISSLPKNSYLGVFSNGIYGDRLFEIAQRQGIKSNLISVEPKKRITSELVYNHVNKFTHIALAHNETSMGTLNDLENIAKITNKYNKVLIVDAISSFGGIPINLNKTNIDFLITSSNKCLHSFPGLSMILAKKDYLNSYKNSSSLSLDMYNQWIDLEKNNQFRFTPPVQIVHALDSAIEELFLEGGVDFRYNKYKKYNKIVRDEMKSIGLKPLLKDDDQGPIVSSFDYPYENFNYRELYSRLKRYNITIYTAHNNNIEVLRLGNIGNISESELKISMEIIKKEISEMIAENTNIL